MGGKKNQTPQTENWNKKRLEIFNGDGEICKIMLLKT